MAVFADNIATFIQSIFSSFVEQAEKCHEYETTFKTLSEEEVQSFKNITSKFIVLLTCKSFCLFINKFFFLKNSFDNLNNYLALLLATDQLLSEIKSKEVVSSHKEEPQEHGELDEMKEVSPEEEDDNSTIQNDSTLSDNILSCIVKCTELFNKPMIHSHILYPFLSV